MSTAKTALITGVTGQDGACGSDPVLTRGYTGQGVERRFPSFSTTAPKPRIPPRTGIAQVYAHYRQQVQAWGSWY